ncbi:MAG: hypothetical protein JF589_17075 [Gemmatimonadetes bacterium]|jgi:hypothetical protein|nr:hypothetical protein [Gemmatimonadota bacterium]
MHVRSRLALRATLVAGLVVFAARPAHAQALAPRTPPADVAAAKRPITGPTMASASLAVRPVEPKELQLNAAAAPKRAGYGQPVALMVVGGGALLTGLIIGGDAGTVIAIGGTVMGLYGLYEYLQ